MLGHITLIESTIRTLLQRCKMSLCVHCSGVIALSHRQKHGNDLEGSSLNAGKVKKITLRWLTSGYQELLS